MKNQPKNIILLTLTSILLTACTFSNSKKTTYTSISYTLPNIKLNSPTITNPEKRHPYTLDYFTITDKPKLPNIAFELGLDNEPNKVIPLNKITPQHVIAHLFKIIQTSNSSTLNAICHQQINDFTKGKTNSIYLIINPAGKANYQFTFNKNKITKLTFTITNQLPFYAYTTRKWYDKPLTPSQATSIFGNQGSHGSKSKTIGTYTRKTFP